MLFNGFISVHLGAGYHSNLKKQAYEKLISIVCKSVLKLLKEEETALECVCEAIRIMENSSFTNAGFGSNLTLCGKVECDASVMEGTDLTFASVGAISNVKNPILVAKTLLRNQQNGLLSLGRIPPCILVGEGANNFAEENGFSLVKNDVLISKRAKELHLHSQTKLSIENSHFNTEISNQAQNPHLKLTRNITTPSLDTVGAICIDVNGNIASAVSSGGIILKHSGRIGQAAVFGAGCWAQTKNNQSVAVTTSGVGEYLIKTLLAQKCSDALLINQDNPFEIVGKVFKNDFLESPFLKNAKSKLAGALITQFDIKSGICEISIVHTTSSMCVGYMTGKLRKPKCIISRLAPGKEPGLAFQIEGLSIDLKTKMTE